MTIRRIGLKTLIMVSTLLAMMTMLILMQKSSIFNPAMTFVLNAFASALIFLNIREGLRNARKQSQKLADRGDEYLKNGKLHSARTCFQESLALNPDNTTAIMGLGNYHRIRKDYSTATEYYQQAVRIDPRSHMAHYLAGACMQRIGDYTNAQEKLEKSIRLKPTFLDPYLPLTDIYLKRGDNKKAEECIKIFLKKPLDEDVKTSIMEKLDHIISQEDKMKGEGIYC